MYSILDYLLFIFKKVVSILSIKPFPDFPVSIIEILLVSIIIKYVFRFMFGGVNELESVSNYFNYQSRTRAINDYRRKQQIVNNGKSFDSINPKYENVISTPASAKEIAELDDLFNSLM